MLVFAGCGNKKETASIEDSDFFTSAVRGEITVSAYDSNNYGSFLEEAAKLFESLYPGTKINIETFSAMPDIRSIEMEDGSVMTVMTTNNDPHSGTDYISRVNTRIMSGSGADLYALDILPLNKLIRSGSFENLDQYMALDPDFNRNDYRQNIIDAVRYLDGTWFMPLNYNFNYFFYDQTLIPPEIEGTFGIDKSFTTEDLLKIGSPFYNGRYKLFDLEEYGLFRYLLNENIQSFVDLETGKANFIDGKFAALLNSARDYSAQGLIHSEIIQMDTDQRIRQYTENSFDRFIFKRQGSFVLFIMFIMGSSPGLVGEDDRIAGIEANADGSVPFGFGHGFAINSQSKNKRLAWEFLKFLLSNKEVQLSGYQGFPLDNRIREEYMEFLALGFDPSGNNQYYRQALENYINAVETLSDKINTYVVRDTSLDDMMSQEVGYFFNGSRSADEVARAIQSKADLYLSE
jgi:multiple sugar transport system substrate-binding protein